SAGRSRLCLPGDGGTTGIDPRWSEGDLEAGADVAGTTGKDPHRRLFALLAPAQLVATAGVVVAEERRVDEADGHRRQNAHADEADGRLAGVVEALDADVPIGVEVVDVGFLLEAEALGGGIARPLAAAAQRGPGVTGEHLE